MIIRLATEADLPAINAIYNHFVLNSTCTYQTEPSSSAERLRWFHDRQDTLLAAGQSPVTGFDAWKPQYPVTVAVSPNDPAEILGWGALNPFHPRAAYKFTTENSVYVHHTQHRRGIGRVLLSDLCARADALGFRNIIALISADQVPSIALHESLGFRPAGLLKNVGYKFDRWLDVAYLQREASGSATDAPAARPPTGH